MVWPTDFDQRLNEFNALDLPGLQLKSSQASSPLDHVLQLDVRAPSACQRLTGILATIGPSSRDQEIMEGMLAAGMNIAMINVLHATNEDNIATIKMLRNAGKEYSVKKNYHYPLAIAVMFAGRTISTGRIGDAYGSHVTLVLGDMVKLTSDETYKDRCSQSTVYVDFLYFSDNVTKGDAVILDKDTIALRVEFISATTVTCIVERGGDLGSYKEVYIPDRFFNMPNYTENDLQHIPTIISQQVEIVIVPYISTVDQITELRKILGEKGKRVLIVPQIQTKLATDNYDEILDASDAVLISRQDLGTDVDVKKLVIYQKLLIARANKARKSVIISAQLLETMVDQQVPMRSELMDVSNCVLDGCDALMLGLETSVGQYPVEAVKCCAAACKEAESVIWTRQIFWDMVDITPIPCDQQVATCLAAVLASHRLIAAAIIVITNTGKTASMLSTFRPRCPVIVVTRQPFQGRQMHLWRACVPLYYDATPQPDWHTDMDRRVNFSIKFGMDHGFIRIGDPIVVVSGWKPKAAATNTMRIVYASTEVFKY